MGIQDFGAAFSLDSLYRARTVARDMTYELSALIRPGMTENDAHAIYKGLSKKYGVEKQWHPAKLRFGLNTVKNFSEISEPHVLQEQDVYFIDIGPIVDGHEADYGETFAIGSEAKFKHIAESSKKVFDEVSAYWLKNNGAGDDLYEFAKTRADHYGYLLNLGSDGHRIGDFPHHIHFKGGLNECGELVVPNAWILEIHLWSKDNSYGAFFEDILFDHKAS